MMCLQNKWGQLTRFGTPEIENKLTALLAKLEADIHANFSPNEYCTVLLTGGYGRGEGGVEQRAGKMYPHNNMDFIFVSSSKAESEIKELKIRFDKLLKPLSSAYGFDLDSFVISKFKLLNLPHNVMLYDMLHGHKTVAGSPGFLSAYFDVSSCDIVPSDVRNLMINRGALFLINQAILKKSVLTLHDKKTVIKHVVKGMIGYGDAFLFSQGRYHWSYAEKQRRMKCLSLASDELKSLYEEAISFRFKPDYEAYLEKDLVAWQARFLKVLPELHLSFEAWRLNQPTLDWSGYIEGSFKFDLKPENWQWRTLVKKFLQLLKAKPDLKTRTLRAQLGYRSIAAFDVLATVYPTIAYELNDNRQEVEQILGQAELADFLSAWGQYVDTNLPTILERHGLNSRGEIT